MERAAVEPTILDLCLAQDLHRAHRNGRPVEETVAGLTRASLAGIMEYGCLRWSHPGTFPPLPVAVADSTLGRALAAVRSELGLRQAGPHSSLPRDTDRRVAEFYVVAGEADILENSDFEAYLLRFEFSAKQIGIPGKAAVALQAALEEMAANVVNHARAPVPALVGYEVRGGVAQFCVVDVGRGVLASLQENPAYGDIAIHSAAIRAALHQGVSRVAGDVRRGFGFNAVFKALAAQWGRLRFRSGEGVITMDGLGLDADHGQERDLPYLDGFQVAVSCRVRPPSP